MTRDMIYGEGKWFLPLAEEVIDQFDQHYGVGKWKIDHVEKGMYTLEISKD
jgi:hypothetical protein